MAGKMAKNILTKLPADVSQIAVGAAAGAVAMTAGEILIAQPIRKNITAWRKKIQDLKAQGETAAAEELTKRVPMGAGSLSATTIKDLTVLGLGIAAKAVAPKSTYTEYATDGIIFFAVADLLTRKIASVSYQFDTEK
jgi:hypothetical protein